jgi:hypothetical protein
MGISCPAATKDESEHTRERDNNYKRKTVSYFIRIRQMTVKAKCHLQKIKTGQNNTHNSLKKELGSLHWKGQCKRNGGSNICMCTRTSQ